jgi:hypothetical protein
MSTLLKEDQFGGFTLINRLEDSKWSQRDGVSR